MTRYFTKEHEWIDADGDQATVGITDFAQAQLGDIVFVELPDSGRQVKRDGDAAVVESVKAASDVYSPVTGQITEANQAIVDDPALVNSAAEGDAWFFRLKLADLSELDSLMDAAAYKAFCENQ